MKPFRRGDKTAAGPLDAGDQWFRPEPATKDKGAASAGPTPDDAPTESFVPPNGWLDKDKGAAGGGVAKAPVKGSGSGAGRSGGSGGSGGGAGRGPGRGGAAAGGAGQAPKKKRKKKHRVQKAMWALLSIVAIGFFMLLVAYSRIDVPDANEVATQQTTQVFYADGETMVGRLGETNRTIVGLDKMPVHLRSAVLAAENRSFYSDNGVSPKGMARAFWNNLSGGSTQGGSTITQQYVKNTYLTTERSIERKLKEALLAIKIDRDKSKDQILEDYLNTIYLGRGAYGVQAAAKAYWNKDVQELNVSQGAALAAIIVRPSAYEPAETDGLSRLKSRWTYVVDSMVDSGTLPQAERDKLKFPKFPEQKKSESRFGGQKGYILTMVRKELEARGLDREQIENGGLRIVTTLDPQAQKAAEDAVAKEFPVAEKKLVKRLRVGLASIEPGSGAIKAMYGGKDFLGKGKFAQVNTATYPIQAGSTMKVFTTAALLENGYTLDDRFDGNSPLQLPGSKPVDNQGFQDFGSITIKRALQQSVNTAFVDSVTELGATTVRKAYVRAGIPDKTPGLLANARITLGIASTPPMDVAGALGTICGGGIRAEPHLVERVIGPNGGEVPIRKTAKTVESVFSEQAIAGTLEAMQGVIENGTGREAQRLGRQAGGKTGTHEGLTAWFSGCTPQLATTVNYFVGDGTKDLPRIDGQSFFGGGFPAKTWTTYMKGALRGVPVEEFPKVQEKKDDEATAKPTKEPDDDVGGADPGLQPAPVLPPVTTPDFPVFSPPPTTVPSPDPPASTPPTAIVVDCSLPENQGDPACAPAPPDDPAECQDQNPNQDEPPFDPRCEDGQLPDNSTEDEVETRGQPGAPGARQPQQTADPEDDEQQT